MKTNPRGKELTSEVYRIVKESWPTYPSAVCRRLGMEPSISNISKVSYHFDLLEKNNHIRTVKIDRALVGWPVEIEKLRVIHDFMRDLD